MKKIAVLLLGIFLLCGCSVTAGNNDISTIPTITPGGAHYFVLVDGTIMYALEKLDPVEDLSDSVKGKVQYIGSAYGFPSADGQSNCEGYEGCDYACKDGKWYLHSDGSWWELGTKESMDPLIFDSQSYYIKLDGTILWNVETLNWTEDFSEFIVGTASYTGNLFKIPLENGQTNYDKYDGCEYARKDGKWYVHSEGAWCRLGSDPSEKPVTTYSDPYVITINGIRMRARDRVQGDYKKYRVGSLSYTGNVTALPNENGQTNNAAWEGQSFACKEDAWYLNYGEDKWCTLIPEN